MTILCSRTGRTRVAAAAVALAAALALGACGGDDGEDPGAGGDPGGSAPATQEPSTEPPALDSEVPDLCTLFTGEDFETLTGETAGEPEVGEPMGVIRGTCTTSAEMGFPLVMVAAYDEKDREATLAMVDAEPVDELGVPADYDDTVGLLIPLEGRDWYVTVTVAGTDDDRAQAIEVGRVVLDRL